MQFPIFIGLHRSHFVDAAVFVVAALATVSAISFPSSALLQMAALLSIWALAILTWRNLKPAIETIRLERSGLIFIARRGETGFLLTVPEADATVHPWLTVIRLKTEDGHRFTLIATVDSLKPSDFRRLRMFLRWQADFNGQNDDA